MLHRRLIPALLIGMTACGVSIENSKPLLFVAPLEGTWTLDTDPNTEFRVTIPGGQPLFGAQFDFTVDIVDAGGTTTYDGSADEQTLTLRDPGTGATVLTGEFLENSMFGLSDGRRFVKPFDVDLTGVWQDVNQPGRYYVVEAQGYVATVVNGGVVTVLYDHDDIESWRVYDTDTGLLAVRAPGFFVGHSAIRIKRIDGYIHLQRANRTESCP